MFHRDIFVGRTPSFIWRLNKTPIKFMNNFYWGETHWWNYHIQSLHLIYNNWILGCDIYLVNCCFLHGMTFLLWRKAMRKNYKKWDCGCFSLFSVFAMLISVFKAMVFFYITLKGNRMSRFLQIKTNLCHVWNIQCFFPIISRKDDV